MDLFSNETDEKRNLMPMDGTVNYFGMLMPAQEADRYFDCLLRTIEWKHDVAILFGKRIVTKREIAWYGEKPFKYTYSNTTKSALPFTAELTELKTMIERRTGEQFNSCLLNLYHSGEEGIAWHSDAEKELEKDGAIASLSLGAERKFLFRHKETKQTIAVTLEHGSLLIMKGNTQTNWLHSLPPVKSVKKPRISLTFRTIASEP
ncbi:MAG TPA: alpha-ketoglutarate-dependent dioxygenase AlkB [Prolixibacteraceae bacterium]